MAQATLAQGNAVLNLILQKKILKEQLQELLRLGLLADLLEADHSLINREKFRKFLGLKPVILVFFDPDCRVGQTDGNYRARMRDQHHHSAGNTSAAALESLLHILEVQWGRRVDREEFSILEKTPEEA